MNQSGKKILKIVLLTLFFVFILGYVFFRSYDLIFGVKIRDVNITDGSRVTESVLQINGTAKNATSLTLGGREISIDQTGKFDEKVALLLGYNVISIRAIDKFGHMDQKNYKLIYQP